MRNTLILVSLLMLGCQPTTHDDLVRYCEDTRVVIGLCEQDTYYITPPVAARCEEQIMLAESMPGCVELEQEYLSCVQDFFVHYAHPEDCRPPSPTYRLWLSVNTYCQDVRSRMTSATCPDPL